MKLRYENKNFRGLGQRILVQVSQKSNDLFMGRESLLPFRFALMPSSQCFF